MKIYVLEYDLEIVKANFSPSETEHRKESYLNITDFIRAVKRNIGKWYISNMKTYVGEVKEIDIQKVIHPF